MRKSAVVLLLMLASVLCLAQDSDKYRACSEKAKSQPEINACASQEADRVDAELNSVYGDLLKKAAGDADALAKIKAAERAWVAYRDAYLEAMYPAKDKQAEYGSEYFMDVNLLRAKLTRQQIAALKDLIAQF